LAVAGAVHADTITNITYTSQTNTSNGGIMLTIDNQGTPNDGNGHTLQGYTAYELTLSTVNQAGGWVNGVIDFGGEQFDPRSGFSGPLVVQSVVSITKGVQTVTPILNDGATTAAPTAGTYYSALGSHFLDDQAKEVAAGPDAFGTITDSIQSTPSDSGYSLGLTNKMVGATGYYLADQSPVQPFAYLVIPNGQSVSFDAQDVIENAAGTQDTINFSGTIPAATPEPASLAILAVGAVGLGLLRRRQSKLN
jgi:hypothetical protein